MENELEISLSQTSSCSLAEGHRARENGDMQHEEKTTLSDLIDIQIDRYALGEVAIIPSDERKRMFINEPELLTYKTSGSHKSPESQLFHFQKIHKRHMEFCTKKAPKPTGLAIRNRNKISKMNQINKNFESLKQVEISSQVFETLEKELKFEKSK